MLNWKLKMYKLTERWRAIGAQSRQAAVEIPNLLARGHLHGMGDGLDVAADDVEALLREPDLPDEVPYVDPG